jgi:hypothetical protein
VQTFLKELRETHKWLACEWDGQGGTMKLEWFHPDQEVGYYNLLLHPRERQTVDAAYDDRSWNKRERFWAKQEAKEKAEKEKQDAEQRDMYAQMKRKLEDQDKEE